MFRHIQSWVFIGRTDVEAETPILWTPDAKSCLFWKDPDAGKDWGREEKGMAENEMAGCHHWLNGHEFESTLGVGDGQGGLAWCSPWGHKELDTTEQLNWTELKGFKLRCLVESRFFWLLLPGIFITDVGINFVFPSHLKKSYFDCYSSIAHEI